MIEVYNRTNKMLKEINITNDGLNVLDKRLNYIAQIGYLEVDYNYV